MYRLFHAGEVPAGLSKMKPPKDDEFGSKGREADYFSKLRRLLAKMEPDDQKLLLHMAQKSRETSSINAFVGFHALHPSPFAEWYTGTLKLVSNHCST